LYRKPVKFPDITAKSKFTECVSYYESANMDIPYVLHKNVEKAFSIQFEFI
jgi:hypothetical protein